MPPLRIWLNRKSLFNLIGENIITIFEKAKKDKNFKEELLQQFSYRLIYFQKGFPKKNELIAKIKSALESFPFSERKFSPFEFLIQTNPNSIIPIQQFIINGRLNSATFFKNHIIPAYQKDISEGKLNSIKSIVNIILFNREVIQTNMLHVFRSLPRVKPDHPLANVWGKVIEIFPEVLAEKYKIEFGNRYSRLDLTSFIEELKVVFQNNPSKQQFLFTFDESVQILTKSFEKFFELKKSIISSNPVHYVQIIKTILDTFIGTNILYNNSTLLSLFQQSILSQLDHSIIDHLILEYIHHPVESGKPLNQE
jgi:hypothetical protein